MFSACKNLDGKEISDYMNKQHDDRNPTDEPGLTESDAVSTQQSLGRRPLAPYTLPALDIRKKVHGKAQRQST